jgi:hypothetical protein
MPVGDAEALSLAMTIEMSNTYDSQSLKDRA